MAPASSEARVTTPFSILLEIDTIASLSPDLSFNFRHFLQLLFCKQWGTTVPGSMKQRFVAVLVYILQDLLQRCNHTRINKCFYFHTVELKVFAVEQQRSTQSMQNGTLFSGFLLQPCKGPPSFEEFFVTALCLLARMH